MGGAADARWLERHDESGERGEGGGGEAPLRRRQLVSASAQLHPSAAAAAGAFFFCFFLSQQGHSCCTCDRKYHKQKTLCVTALQPTASHSLEKH